MARPHVVYLSSSAHADWRAEFRKRFEDDLRVVFVGPCENHALSDAMGAPGDQRPGHKLRIMQMMRKCDLVFAAIPDDRYRAFNVLLEIGLAKAWGRRVLFVNVPESLEDELAFVRPYVDEYFRSLDQGLARLTQIVQGEPLAFTPGPELQKLLAPTGEVWHRVALVGYPDSSWMERVHEHYANDADVELIENPNFERLVQCDFVLAARTGPRGRLFEIPFAIGVAAGLNVQVLFVNEGDDYSHAYDYVKPFSEGYYRDLNEALRYLDYAMGIEARL